MTTRKISRQLSFKPSKGVDEAANFDFDYSAFGGYLAEYSTYDSRYVLSSGDIIKLNDISGNGYDMTVLGSDAAPPFANNQIDFATVSATFDRIGNEALGPVLDNNQPFSVHVVCSYDNAASNQHIILALGDTTTNNRFHSLQCSGSGQWRLAKRTAGGNYTPINFGTADDDLHVFSMVFTGSAVSVWVDGVKLVDNTALSLAAVPYDNFRLGGLLCQNQDVGCDGQFEKLVVYNAAHSDADALAINQALMEESGIS